MNRLKQLRAAVAGAIERAKDNYWWNFERPVQEYADAEEGEREASRLNSLYWQKRYQESKHAKHE